MEDIVRYYGLDTIASPTSNQLMTKENNAKLLFSIVMQQGTISRAQLAKESGLSPSTVSLLTDEMIRRRILLEAGAGESAPTGRKPVLLKVDPEGLQIPCFAFQPNGLLYVLYDLQLNVTEQRFIPYPPQLQPRTEIYTPSEADVLSLFTAVLGDDSKIDSTKLRVIAISFYGAFLRDNNLYSSAILGWHLNASFLDTLRRSLANIPVFIGNVATLAAYAEKTASAVERENLLYLHLDHGVGSGIILNNRPFTGDCGISGEIGHMIINGKRLENIVGSATVLRELHTRCGVDSFAAAAMALERQEPRVIAYLSEVAAAVATAINNTLCMLGSMDVFIGGCLTELGPAFLKLIQTAIQQFGFHRVLPHSPLSFSCLPPNGDCLGAARAYVDSMFTVVTP